MVDPDTDCSFHEDPQHWTISRLLSDPHLVNHTEQVLRLIMRQVVADLEVGCAYRHSS